MGQFSIGQSVRRREDPRLLTGRGRYFDDLKLADQLHAAIVRSPHAHADIKGIDTRAALQMPGVHAVLTGKDYRGRRPRHAAVDGALQEARRQPDVPAARGRPSRSTACMHVGYPVAVVVADTLDLARDAAERVEVDYAPRPAVVSARDAFEPGAPQLYDDCPNNEAYFYQAGDKAKTDAAFANAAHVVEQRLVINRVTANTIEPRGVTGVYDRRHRPLHAALRLPAAVAVPQRHRRNHDEDSGGGASADHRRHRRLLRPARLGLSGDHPDAVGGAPRRPAGEMDCRPATKRTSATTTRATTSSMRRWRSTGTANSSACTSAASAISAPSCRFAARCRRWSISARWCGTYTTPALHVAISGMLTNTHCTSPYRGAGRPEASYMIERLIDIAADEMKIDPAELRRRNTIPP